GKVTTRGGPGVGGSLAIDNFGRIVAAAKITNGNNNYDFAVARYNPDGSLDSSYGVGGIVVTPIGLGNDTPGQVAIDAAGRIVVQGNTWNGSNYDFAVVRYRASGSNELISADPNGALSRRATVGEPILSVRL